MINPRLNLPREAASSLSERIYSTRSDKNVTSARVSFNFHEHYEVQLERTSIRDVLIMVTEHEKYRTLEAFMQAYGLGRHDCLQLKPADLLITVQQTASHSSMTPSEASMAFRNFLKEKDEILLCPIEWSCGNKDGMGQDHNTYSIFNGDLDHARFNELLEEFIVTIKHLYIQVFFPEENICICAGSLIPLISHHSSVETYIFHQQYQKE